MADSLGYNKSFAVSSSGRSGGLGIFWNDEIKVEVIGDFNKVLHIHEHDGVGQRS